jgi:hypothetical protein
MSGIPSNAPAKPKPPAVIVHGMADVRLALASRQTLQLLSAPGAALYAGAGWWRALVTQARALAPTLITGDILDCADAAGHALAAMRLGQPVLVLRPTCPGREAVVAAAAETGTLLLDWPPPALDLGQPNAAYALQNWLRGVTAQDG